MLSVRGSRELQATVLALKQARRDIRNDINRTTRQVMNPVWRGLVADRASTPLARRVLNTGVRVAAGNPPQLIAAGSRRALPGGLVPASDWHGVEFGANPDQVTTYRRRSKNGGTHPVRRHTTRQLPRRTRAGRVVWPAVRDIAPRLASLWVQMVVRKFAEATEKGG